MIQNQIGNSIKWVAARTANSLNPGAIILLYHRVAELDLDPWALSVSPKHFSEHMHIIKDYYKPIKLQYLRQNLIEAQNINKSVVVTFDDGYADNYHSAKPILEKYEIPATLFITAGYIDKNIEFWWDYLEKIIFLPDILPDSLKLSIDGINYEWELCGTSVNIKNEHYKAANWPVLSGTDNDQTDRCKLYSMLYYLLQKLGNQERDQIIKDLFIWANIDSGVRDTHRLLSINELIQLDQSGLIEVGAHTMTHSLLAKTAYNLQKKEIENCKVILENMLGYSIKSFAYPHGSFNDISLSLVREAGFNCACSTFRSRVRHNNNIYLLPRVTVGDKDGDKFARWLKKII